MKKQQTDLAYLGGKLTKTDMKKLKGGAEAVGEGMCILCFHTCGYASCWYTNDPQSLCERVYPGHVYNPNVLNVVPDCEGCTMN
jgi:hypothetical protein